MKSYILLRNNKESGPYTLNELNARSIYSKDLIWIEGESSSWQSASEIDGLKLGMEESKEEIKHIPKKIIRLTNNSAFAATETRIKISEPVTITARSSEKKELIKDDYSFDYQEQELNLFDKGNRVKSNQRVFTFNYNLVGLGVLLIGAMMGAFIVKQMVDSFDGQQEFTGEAKEIESIKIPVSTTTHSAEAVATPIRNEITLTALPVKKDSVLTTAKINAKTLVAALHKKDTNKLAAVIKKESNDMITVKNTVAVKSITPSKNEEEKKSIANETTRPKTTKAPIEISANDYKVGLLGGISGLELSLTNSSGETVENAVIEVEFLKPNGSVAKSEIVQIQNITPGSSKKVEVPSSNRGVKVRYRLISQSAKEAVVATDNM